MCIVEEAVDRAGRLNPARAYGQIEISGESPFASPCPALKGNSPTNQSELAKLLDQ